MTRIMLLAALAAWSLPATADEPMKSDAMAAETMTSTATVKSDKMSTDAMLPAAAKKRNKSANARAATRDKQVRRPAAAK